LDFYNNSGIPKNDFESLFAQNSSERDMLLDIALSTHNYVYLRLDKCPDNVVESIKQWDIGDGSNQFIAVADYIPCAFERLDHWVNFHISCHVYDDNWAEAEKIYEITSLCKHL